MEFFAGFFKQVHSCLSHIDFQLLLDATDMIKATKAKDGRVWVIGNGGSAAMASHVSVDLTKAAGVRSQCFSDADMLTCFANDYGYEYWVEKAVEFYAKENDTVILISSSGRSPNIINGAIKARDMGLNVITLSGFEPDNPLRKLGDINLYVPSKGYNIIETVHQTWLLSIVDKIVGTVEYPASPPIKEPRRSQTLS